jgi:DNA polymerase-3 subunit gamma/tau
MGSGAPAGSGVARGPTVMRSVASTAQAVGAPGIADMPENVAVAVNSFQDVVALFGARKQALLQSQIVNFVHLVKFEQGHLAIRVKENAPHNLVGQMSERLSQWTGQRWIVSISREQGEPTIGEQRQSEAQSVMNEVKASPIIAEALKVFPGAQVIDIRTKT